MRRYLRLMFLAATVILLTGLPAPAVFADETVITQKDIDEGVTFCRDFPVSLQVDGEMVESDVPPVIVKGRTLIPAKAVFEDMGADVSWNEDARLVTITLGSSEVMLTIDSNIAFVNGTQAVMDVPALIIDSRTMIPVSFVGKSLSCGIAWDDVGRTVLISSPAAGSRTAVSQIRIRERDDSYRVIIDGDGEFKGYKSFTYTDPERFVIDIKGAVLDLKDMDDEDAENGRIDSDRDNDLFSSVRFSQFEGDTVRIVVDLDVRAAGKVSFSPDKDRIYIDFDKEQAEEHEELGNVTEDGLDVVDWRAAEKLVVIDPGHGGNDPGSQAIRDGVEILNEKDINLDIALRLKRMLDAAGVSTYILREEDTPITLYERPAMANAANGDLYVSVHNNSFPENPSAKGTEVYYYSKANEADYGIYSKRLAELVYEELLSTLGTDGRKVKSEPAYAVLNKTQMPAIIIEGAFLSNADDLKLMMTDEYRQNYALAAAKAIIQVLNESVADENN
ncbi:MAG TPA: N-acetylmuramoyl-L-alanine amidase family protein [Anaerovoracaceae bacterium]|nr:N-acetylmuramoyl-L-alanine amidase family protein [Anaerovoracaceae bacterium]